MYTVFRRRHIYSSVCITLTDEQIGCRIDAISPQQSMAFASLTSSFDHRVEYWPIRERLNAPHRVVSPVQIGLSRRKIVRSHKEGNSLFGQSRCEVRVQPLRHAPPSVLY
jgi:hypothetical protein